MTRGAALVARAMAALAALILSCGRPGGKRRASRDVEHAGDAALRAEAEAWWGSKAGTGIDEIPLEYAAYLDVAACSVPVVRRLGEGELGASRGEPEDYLRKEVLELLWEEEDLEVLRDVLNRPWDTAGVEHLGEIVLSYQDPRRRGPPDGARSRILNLLAHVATKGGEDGVTQEIRKLFDHLFRDAALYGKSNVRGAYPWAWAVNAIENYGSAEFLTDSFWKGYEADLQGYRVLVAVGDEEVLARLKEYDKRPPWTDKSCRGSLKDTILLIEAQLKFPQLKNVKNLLKRERRARDLMRQRR